MTEEKTYKEIAEEIKNILFIELEKQGDNIEIDHDNVRVKILNDNTVYNIYLTVPYGKALLQYEDFGGFAGSFKLTTEEEVKINKLKSSINKIRVSKFLTEYSK